MPSVKIFVEGVADKEFLFQYIDSILNKVISEENIISLQGKDRLKLKVLSKLEKISNLFLENTKAGGVNLLIFDANGNKEQRILELNNLRQKLGIDFIQFLLPNDADAGALENLLLKIVPSNSSFLTCFNDYENCIAKNNNYKSPVLKTKIYAYLDTLDIADKGLAKEGNRNYLLSQQWDLGNDYLNPLRDFLLKYL